MFVFLFVSCQRDEIIFIPDQNYQINRETLINSLIKTQVTYQFQADDQDLTLFLPKQAVLQLPAGSLIKPDGNQATGFVKVHFDDVSANKSGLLKAPSLTYNNTIIDAGKATYIRFEQDGKPLELKSSAFLYLPSESSNEVSQLYYAEENSSNWQSAVGTGQNLQPQKWDVIYKDGMIPVIGYRVSITGKGGWYCIGKTENGIETAAQLSVILPSGFNSSNTLVYWVSDNSKTSLRLEAEGNSTVFNSPHLKIAEFAEGKIVSVSDFGGDNYYFGTRNAVFKKDASISLIPEKQNLSEIKNLLLKL